LKSFSILKESKKYSFSQIKYRFYQKKVDINKKNTKKNKQKQYKYLKKLKNILN